MTTDQQQPCLFCSLTGIEIVASEGSVVAFHDKFPVTSGHLLIIPVVHRRHFFELSQQEVLDSWTLIHRLRTKLLQDDTTIDGFNIGMNCELSAGQTVFHSHIHLIPRRSGDTSKPKGGVRGVIPGKQAY